MPLMSKDSKKDYAQYFDNPSELEVITRSKQDLTYQPEQPAILPFDHDFSEYCTTQIDSPDQLIDLVNKYYTRELKVDFYANIGKKDENLIDPRKWN